MLSDPKQLLKGTGKLIRHIPISSADDYNNTVVKDLIREAIVLAQSESKSLNQQAFRIISKIKK
ncbi:hypothetical protein WPG_3165 [Winogradskyella sp. PG-2]|nr:hypothetical protein WPG_3165 [Winogradskyella sp. PG-2]